MLYNPYNAIEHFTYTLYSGEQMALQLTNTVPAGCSPITYSFYSIENATAVPMGYMWVNSDN